MTDHEFAEAVDQLLDSNFEVIQSSVARRLSHKDIRSPLSSRLFFRSPKQLSQVPRSSVHKQADVAPPTKPIEVETSAQVSPKSAEITSIASNATLDTSNQVFSKARSKFDTKKIFASIAKSASDKPRASTPTLLIAPSNESAKNPSITGLFQNIKASIVGTSPPVTARKASSPSPTEQMEKEASTMGTSDHVQDDGPAVSDQSDQASLFKVPSPRMALMRQRAGRIIEAGTTEVMSHVLEGTSPEIDPTEDETPIDAQEVLDTHHRKIQLERKRRKKKLVQKVQSPMKAQIQTSLIYMMCTKSSRNSN